MQYLLSEAEYEGIMQKLEEKRMADENGLQEFCTKVAEEMPIVFWGNPEVKTWGCILSPERGHGYCDECPSKKLCPHPHKEWSK